MKKFLIATNIILLSVAIFFCYKFFDSKNVKSGKDLVLSADTGSGNAPCRSRLCKDYSNQPWTGLVRADVAQQMASRYRADLGKNVIWFGNNQTNTLDATSVWFNLDKLKKFIWEVESRQCRSNCGDTLGVRIYYAKYPDSIGMRSGSFSTLNPAYANHHTLFMVPTYWDGNLQANVDFDPFNGCRGRISTGFGSKPGLIFWDLSGGGDGDAQNHGSLIPPGTSSGTGF